MEVTLLIIIAMMMRYRRREREEILPPGWIPRQTLRPVIIIMSFNIEHRRSFSVFFRRLNYEE